MSPTSAGITDHYASTDIAARLLAALRAAQGPDAPITPDVLAQMDHFHGGGITSTRDLVAALAAGGRRAHPRHWQRHRRAGALDRQHPSGVHVTGIDLTAGILPRRRAATHGLTGLVEQVRIGEGSALAMPSTTAGSIVPIAERRHEHRRQARLLSRGLESVEAGGPTGAFQRGSRSQRSASLSRPVGNVAG